MKQTSPNLKKSILAFVKNLVSKKVYAAIEILLTPCCKPVVLSAEAVCNSETGITTLTLKVDKNVTTFNSENASFYIYFGSPNNIIIGSINPNSLNGAYVFEFQIDDFGGTYEATFEIFLPTSSDGLIGVSVTSEPFQVTLPTCNLPIT